MSNTTKKADTMPKPEPINCCGMTDWTDLTYLRAGMLENLQAATMANCEELAASSKEIDQERYKLLAVFNSIKQITHYREQYLIRRIYALEKALGISNHSDTEEVDISDLGSNYYKGNNEK